MEGKQQIDALGRLEGVRDASLINADGGLVASSGSESRAESLVASFNPLISQFATAAPQMSGNLHLTIEAAAGGVQFAQEASRTLIVLTTSEANIGAIKIEMRDALASLS